MNNLKNSNRVLLVGLKQEKKTKILTELIKPYDKVCVYTKSPDFYEHLPVDIFTSDKELDDLNIDDNNLKNSLIIFDYNTYRYKEKIVQFFSTGRTRDISTVLIYEKHTDIKEIIRMQADTLIFNSTTKNSLKWVKNNYDIDEVPQSECLLLYYDRGFKTHDLS